ncbi:MAG: DUF4296 domain-containing protein [Thermaurantimonas sp.]
MSTFSKNIFFFFLGVPLTKSLARLIRVGVFRGALRFRAASLAMLGTSHRPALRSGRTPSTSRRARSSWPAQGRTLSPPLPHTTLPAGPFALCIWLFITTSCVRIEIPPDVLPPETMAALMADLHLLEGRRMGDKVLYAEEVAMADYYALIFQKHGISPDQYKRSHHFYSQYPELFSGIYDLVIETLQQRQIESENIPRHTPDTTEDNF